MQKQKQQSKTSPDTMYILATIQMSSEDALIKRTGFFVGFGGAQGQMFGLEDNRKLLSFYDNQVYTITQVNWNFGKKHRMKFFELTEKSPAVDKYVREEALEFVRKLWGHVVNKLGIGKIGYYNTNRIYKNIPDIIETEVIAEKKGDNTPKPTSAPPARPSLDHPDGVPQEKKGTPSEPKTTSSTTTNGYTKRRPTMFSRKSTERVKARVLYISQRLDEILAAAVEDDDSNMEGSQFTAAPTEQTGQTVKDARERANRNFSKLCVDCSHRWRCSYDVRHMAYCSRKELETTFANTMYPI